jgi:hypothetical protein
MDQPSKKTLPWMTVFWVIIGFLVVAYFIQK